MKIEKGMQVAEISANLAVVLTLIFLALQVRQNSALVERQIAMEYNALSNASFLDANRLSEVMTKIYEVDQHVAPNVAVFMDAYGLSISEADLWERHLSSIWIGMLVDYNMRGESPELTGRIETALGSPSSRLFWGAIRDLSRPDFIEYVERSLPDSTRG